MTTKFWNDGVDDDDDDAAATSGEQGKIVEEDYGYQRKDGRMESHGVVYSR